MNLHIIVPHCNIQPKTKTLADLIDEHHGALTVVTDQEGKIVIRRDTLYPG